MNIEQMEQNAALELFRYLKEHLIPLAKNKNDKIFESDVTIQITRSINKDIWNCEEEVKQLLSKTESMAMRTRFAVALPTICSSFWTLQALSP